MKKWFWKWIQVVAGTLLMAAAVNFAYEPSGMVTGGISGMAIIIRTMSMQWSFGPIPVWLLNLLLNVPIFVLAFFVMGKRYVWQTFVTNLLFSVSLYVLPVQKIFDDLLLVTVFGGVCSGLGLGIIFREELSTGGTDLLSAILHRFFPRQRVSAYLFFIDSGIIVWGMFLFGIRMAGYAVIAVFLSAKIMNEILSGMNYAKMIYVISSRYEEIGENIMTEMDRGLTLFHGMGMYTKNSQPILMSVVTKREMAKFIRIVKKYDKNAFIIITDITEVFGEGFVENRQ